MKTAAITSSLHFSVKRLAFEFLQVVYQLCAAVVYQQLHLKENVLKVKHTIRNPLPPPESISGS